MTVTIELSPPLRSQADLLAAKRGQSVPELFISLLKESWSFNGIEKNGISDRQINLTAQQALKKKQAIQKVLREHEELWEKLAQL